MLLLPWLPKGWAIVERANKILERVAIEIDEMEISRVAGDENSALERVDLLESAIPLIRKDDSDSA